MEAFVFERINSKTRLSLLCPTLSFSAKKFTFISSLRKTRSLIKRETKKKRKGRKKEEKEKEKEKDMEEQGKHDSVEEVLKSHLLEIDCKLIGL